jgi:hypothetical protein
MKTVVYDGSSFSESLDDWDVILEMRKAIYCVECLIPIDAEFDEKQETNSRHLICYGEAYRYCSCSTYFKVSHVIIIYFHTIFAAKMILDTFSSVSLVIPSDMLFTMTRITAFVSPAKFPLISLIFYSRLHAVGDAPIAVARYRILVASDGITYTEIDRLGILSAYRGQNFLRRIMMDILSDSQNFSHNLIKAIMLSVPIESWMKCKLESLGWSDNPKGTIEQRGPKTYSHMTFHAQPS